jgi:Lantibiotic dehydratase, N terminus
MEDPMREARDHETNDFPVIVRIAGLPADAVAPFASELCRNHFQRLEILEESYARARAELVERVCGMIQGAPVSQRRILLALKRDCFNGRDLGRYHSHHELSAAEEGVKAQVAQVHLVAGQLQLAQADFEAAYQVERHREIHGLLSFLEDRKFLRGVALSSSAITESLPRLLGKPPEAYGRRERRLVTSLLRYVSRAALKLSPFSSLTGIGLGLITRIDGGKALQLIPEDSWEERSKVRLQRYRVEQLLSFLMHNPPFRAHLRIAVNDTVEAVAEGRYRLLRGAFWHLDPQTLRLREARPAWVAVRLRGPLIRWLLDNATAPVRTYQELLEELPAVLPGHPGETLRETIDKLLDIGFLCFGWPWGAADSHPEKRLLEFLESLPETGVLMPLIRSLDRLLELEEDYSRSDSPARLVTELRNLTRDVLRTAAPLAQIDPQATDDDDERLLHEDLFFQSDRPGQEIALLASSQAREIFDNLVPFSRLSNIESLRFDFLHTLASFASERWPGQEEVQFLDLFDEAFPLFEAYIKHEIDARVQGARERASFNPFRLDRIEWLGQARQKLASELRRCLIVEGEEALLDREALARHLETIPSPYSDPRDFCAFLQPLNDAGTDWVLNLLTEGVGRLSSRFTTTMGPCMQRFFVGQFLRHASWMSEGEEVELVDLFCTAGHSANVHVPYTRRVFEIPGASAGLPPERCLRLHDLKVRFLGSGRLPDLVDCEHRRILPMHLGPVARAHMPSLVKFLALFGPGDFRYRRPTLPSRKVDGVTIVARHRLGNIVYRRKTWVFETAPLRAALAGLTEPAAFRLLNRWRSNLGIPDRAFLAEPLVIAPQPYTKPQYVDFTSPLLVEIFRSAIHKEIARLKLTEALPEPEGQFMMGGRHRRALELQLESFGIPPSPSAERPLPMKEGAFFRSPERL